MIPKLMTGRNVQNTLRERLGPSGKDRGLLSTEPEEISAQVVTPSLVLPRSHATDPDEEIIQQSYFHLEDRHGGSLESRTEARAGSSSSEHLI